MMPEGFVPVPSSRPSSQCSVLQPYAWVDETFGLSASAACNYGSVGLSIQTLSI